MGQPAGRVGGWVRRYASRLRFPRLLALTLALLAIDLAWPDPLPLVDEVVLALVAALLGSLRRSGREDAGSSAPADGAG